MKNRFFEEAKKESQLSDYDRIHIGACAVYRDKFIIARAHNTSKTNPTQYFYNRFRADGKSNIMLTPPRSHAETELYRKIRYLDIDFKDVVVYLYRELKNGVRAIAKPCDSCEKLLRDLGVKVVCYTGNDSYIEERFR